MINVYQAAEEIVKQIQEFNEIYPIDFTTGSKDMKELRLVVFRILLKYEKLSTEKQANGDHV